MIKAVPTVFGEEVTTHAYDLLFDMIGPEGPEEYRFDFRFNERMDRWVLTIYNSQDRIVVLGAPVVLGVNLLSYASPGLQPRGLLTCIWTTDTPSAREPGEKDLGAWCSLIYAERPEDFENEEPTDPPTA